MGGLYQWVGSILCYLILISAIRAVLPSGKYEKYIRLFTGMILILVVVQPITEGFELGDRLAYYFEAISFQRESEDLKREILGIEEQRLERVVKEYEGAVERDVKGMAEDLGFFVERVEVAIESEQERENYGAVSHVFMVVRRETDEKDGWDEEGEAEWEKIQIGTIEIEPVEAGGKISGGKEDGQQEGVRKNAEKTGEGDRQEVEQLRRKVERYYGLESQEVEIEFKGRQG